uniref:RNase H type-1 domain-containing protein n=1 Tax=Chenopodium quinoa TaxID=63459 RepID=A0A803MVY7_CHEQI
MVLHSNEKTFLLLMLSIEQSGLLGNMRKQTWFCPLRSTKACQSTKHGLRLLLECSKLTLTLPALVTKPLALEGVMRDHTNDIMAATCVQVQGSFEIDVAKVMAVRHALLIAMESGLSRVILEMDNLVQSFVKRHS